MSDIQFSVVIPTYHRNDLLVRCLQQLAPGRQTLDASRYEVIVTDDGRDTTAERMIREHFPFARWVKGPQRGPAANRNSGARHVTSDWIVFLDDDCIPTAGWLAAFSLSIARGLDLYEGRTTCKQGCRLGLEEAPVNLAGGLLWSCNMMIRASRFADLGGFDEHFPAPMFEDVDFAERAKLAGLQSQFVPEAEVDHPPRPTRRGVAAGRIWESRALFIYKHQQRETIRWWLPAHLLRVRLSRLRKIGLTKGLMTVLWSDVQETLYVLAHAGQWERKYRLRFKPKGAK